jgi:hypothetical protein
MRTMRTAYDLTLSYLENGNVDVAARTEGLDHGLDHVAGFAATFSLAVAAREPRAASSTAARPVVDHSPMGAEQHRLTLTPRS